MQTAINTLFLPERKIYTNCLVELYLKIVLESLIA